MGATSDVSGAMERLSSTSETVNAPSPLGLLPYSVKTTQCP